MNPLSQNASDTPHEIIWATVRGWALHSKAKECLWLFITVDDIDRVILMMPFPWHQPGDLQDYAKELVGRHLKIATLKAKDRAEIYQTPVPEGIMPNDDIFEIVVGDLWGAGRNKGLGKAA